MSRTPDHAGTILIASNHNDREVWQPIVNRLPPQFDHVVFEGDAIASQRRPLKIELDRGGMHVWYDGRELALNGFRAALYLRPNMAYKRNARWTDDLSEEQARGVLYDTLWEQVPKDRWLNPPDNMRKLTSLMGQLAVAREVGFAVPHTLVTGDMVDVAETFPHGAVHKSSPHLIFGQDGMRIMQATHVRNINDLPLDELDPHTSYWQDYAEGTSWYAMAIGDRVFAAQLHTDGDDPGAHYMPNALPAQAQAQCRDYLKLAGLGMAAFSLVDTGGDMTCVGVNPYGHPGWVAHDLHQPVLEAMADELTAIAMRD